MVFNKKFFAVYYLAKVFVKHHGVIMTGETLQLLGYRVLGWRAKVLIQGVLVAQ